ncbi:hypothetical protein ACJX0J_021197, partial [Zea mays]
LPETGRRALSLSNMDKKIPMWMIGKCENVPRKRSPFKPVPRSATACYYTFFKGGITSDFPLQSGFFHVFFFDKNKAIFFLMMLRGSGKKCCAFQI